MNIRVAARRPRPASTRDKIGNFLKLVLQVAVLGLVGAVVAATVTAQTPPGTPGGAQTSAPATQELSAAPAQVDVKPVAHDEEIRQRLQSVLDATEWFTAPQVMVREGVVFLKGRAPSASLKKWAGDLAGKTQDV
ncbi:MAG: BON domain-containing protein, partial [Verrucomicrobiota bacterium]|nr:BON domain-containing protein [Verrucomicrobiota bacterium]